VDEGGSGINRLIAIGFIFVLLSLTLSGCWSYRELDSMMIVSGLAVDKGERDGQVMLTVEIVDVLNSSKNAANGSITYSMTGDSLFSTVRNFISVTGKKLYWSHAKIIILSKEAATEGASRFLDWFARDTETRADMFVLISEKGKAKDILSPALKGKRIISFEIADILKKQKSLEKAPSVEIWDMFDRIERIGSTPTAPLVKLIKSNGEWTEQVEGAAVLKLGKYVGDLNGEQVFYYLFAKDLIRGGTLVIDGQTMKNAITLEVQSSRTKRSIYMKNGKPGMRLFVQTNVNLDEIRENIPFDNKKDLMAMQVRASRALENRIAGIIELVQTKYASDIFGFGDYIHEHDPKLWKKLRGNWHEEFKTLQVDVRAEVRITSTGKSSDPIKVVE
jgi:spore germination protein KC